jgi:hypothetical protein
MLITSARLAFRVEVGRHAFADVSHLVPGDNFSGCDAALLSIDWFPARSREASQTWFISRREVRGEL